jgi:hypothetical protein
MKCLVVSGIADVLPATIVPFHRVEVSTRKRSKEERYFNLVEDEFRHVADQLYLNADLVDQPET